MNANVRFVLLFAADQLFAAFFVTPLVVAFWRGAWDLLDLHFLSQFPEASAWTTLTAGLLGLSVLASLQQCFKRCHIVQYSIAWVCLSHLYSYVGAVFAVLHWRGLWNVLDIYTGTGPVSFAVCLLIGQVLLWLLRANKCAAAPPQIILMDISRDIFNTPSRFSTDESRRVAYIADHVFTTFIPGSAAICVWRGFWGLADLYFYPDVVKHSALLSLFIGYCVFVLCVPLQLACNLLYKEMLNLEASKLWRTLLEDFVYLIGNFGAIHMWRGLRMGLSLMLLPDHVDASLAVGHVCGFVILSLALTSDSVQARGFSLTGARSLDSCLFENQFFRAFFSAPNDPQYSTVQQSERPESNLSRKIVKYRNAIVRQSMDGEDDRQVLVTESNEI